jgi:hypothetical protein
MGVESRYPEKLDGIDRLREPFRAAFTSEIGQSEPIQILVYSPAFTTVALSVLASVVAVTTGRWVIASEGEDGQIRMEAAAFADTLLIELTIILLCGQFKVGFIKEGIPVSIAAQFNTVMTKYYQEAVELLLAGIEAGSGEKGPQGEVNERVVRDWPMKFQSVALTYAPVGRQLMSGMYWDALYGGFNRELSPASALLRTEKELVLITEEKLPGRFHFHREEKQGEIITYFPLSQLAEYRIVEQPRVGTLSLQVHASHGAETLEIPFPKVKRGQVHSFMESMMGKTGASTRTSDPNLTPTPRERSRNRAHAADSSE